VLPFIWPKVLFIKKEAVALHLTTPQTLQSAPPIAHRPLALGPHFLSPQEASLQSSKCIKNSLSLQNLKEQQKTATRTTTVNRPICKPARQGSLGIFPWPSPGGKEHPTSRHRQLGAAKAADGNQTRKL